MTKRTVGRICIGCGRLFTPGSSTTRCTPCVRKQQKAKDQARPWYRTPEYRAAQRAASKQTGQPCPRCRKPMAGRHRPSVDHIKPVSQGGSWYGPFQVVCLVCNISKHNKTPKP